MAFAWEDYYEIAKKLNGIACGSKSGSPLIESFHRTSASRAYYAIFNVAKIFAEQKLSYISLGNKTSEHTRLKDFFNNINDVEYKELSKNLNIMKRNRQYCDYDVSIRNPKKMAEDTLLKAEKSFEIINNKII
jgi:uncharacterized protein (UPF0332 family)